MDDLRYNTDNDNENPKWEKDVAGKVIEGEVVERISKSDLQNITVTGCKHLNTSSKPAEEFDNMLEYTCNDCPIGWFVSSSTKP